MARDPAGKARPIRALLLQYGLPPLLTAVLGFTSGLYLSHLGQVSTERHLYLESRIKQAESVADHFDQYIENWRRLIQIATYEREKGKLSPTEAERKNGYVLKRDLARDRLFGALGVMELYFSPQTLQTAAAFRRWDEAQAVKGLGQLPPIEAWRQHKTAVITAIRNEMEGKP